MAILYILYGGYSSQLNSFATINRNCIGGNGGRSQTVEETVKHSCLSSNLTSKDNGAHINYLTRMKSVYARTTLTVGVLSISHKGARRSDKGKAIYTRTLM